MANVLNMDKKIAVIGALAEGSSIRSIERITGVHRDTIHAGVQKCQPSRSLEKSDGQRWRRVRPRERSFPSGSMRKKLRGSQQQLKPRIRRYPNGSGARYMPVFQAEKFKLGHHQSPSLCDFF